MIFEDYEATNNELRNSIRQMEEINDHLVFENKTLTMSQLAANQTPKLKGYI